MVKSEAVDVSGGKGGRGWGGETGNGVEEMQKRLQNEANKKEEKM